MSTVGDPETRERADLPVQARLVGNRAPVVAQLLRALPGADEWAKVKDKKDLLER